jgi:hypothetical protein
VVLFAANDSSTPTADAISVVLVAGATGDFLDRVQHPDESRRVRLDHAAGFHASMRYLVRSSAMARDRWSSASSSLSHVTAA